MNNEKDEKDEKKPKMEQLNGDAHDPKSAVMASPGGKLDTGLPW